MPQVATRCPKCKQELLPIEGGGEPQVCLGCNSLLRCPGCNGTLQLLMDGNLPSICPRSDCLFPWKMVQGVYRAVHRIGKGGFGAVYLAYHTMLHQWCAIKILRRDLDELFDDRDLSDAERAEKVDKLVQRFFDEARLMSHLGIENPHIVRIENMGKDPDLGLFYVMEYLEGTSLETVLRSKRLVKWSEVFSIFEQLCRGLAHVHEHGVVHRDMKPANIMLVPRAEGQYIVKLIDFGIAKSMSNQSGLTTGFVGTTTYSSPEQFRNPTGVDHRADICAIGAILYHTLTGTPPFVQKDPQALMYAHVFEKPESMRLRRPDLPIPEGLDRVVLKALAKKPSERFQTAIEFWDALAPYDPRLDDDDPTTTHLNLRYTIHSADSELAKVDSEGFINVSETKDIGHLAQAFELGIPINWPQQDLHAPKNRSVSTPPPQSYGASVGQFADPSDLALNQSQVTSDKSPYPVASAPDIQAQIGNINPIVSYNSEQLQSEEARLVFHSYTPTPSADGTLLYTEDLDDLDETLISYQRPKPAPNIKLLLVVALVILLLLGAIAGLSISYLANKHTERSATRQHQTSAQLADAGSRESEPRHIQKAVSEIPDADTKTPSMLQFAPDQAQKPPHDADTHKLPQAKALESSVRTDSDTPPPPPLPSAQIGLSQGHRAGQMRIIRPSEINIWPETKAVWIPAGQFWMGSPTNEIGRFSNEYRHRVDLQQGFWLWQTEVTQGQFTALMGYNPSRSQQYGSALPVERVSWHEAVFFAHTLSQKMDLPSCFSCQGEGNSVICQSLPQFAGQKYYECKGWRLPTEAEWEYAYRAGSDTSLYNGQLAAPLGYDPILDLLAWYDKNSNQRPHPVARKQPNAWGLFDMAGNVEEWCWNWYARYPQKSLVSNPSGPLKGSERVIRGGSWYDSARKARAAERGSLAPSWREDTVGFRLVCTGL